MSKHQLEIIMKLKDELSKRLEGVQGNLLRFSNRVKELGSSLRSTGKMISQVGKTMALFGGLITGPLVLAFRQADKYSGAVHNQLERLKNLTATFQIQIATALVPLMEKFINILGALFNAWNSLGPATQQMIVQGAAMVGIFLTVGGSVAFLIGKLVNLSGIISLAAGNFLKFVAINPYLAVIMASIVILIGLMIRFKGVSDAVFNGIELSLLTVQNGFEFLKSGIMKIFALLEGLREKLFNTLAKIPGKNQELYRKVAQDARKAREELDRLSKQGFDTVIKNSEKMGKILTGSRGSLAEGFENVKNKVSGLWDKLKNPPPFNIKPIVERLKSLKEIADDIFKAMERGMSDFFYNSVIEKSFKLQNFFQQLGQSILRIWTDLLAQMLTRWLKTMTTMQSGSGGAGGMSWLGILGKVAGIFGGTSGVIQGGVGGTNTGMQSLPSISGGQPFPTWSPYHTGGPIFNRLLRAHKGLAMDEVPIIAKRGEYILSERGVAAAGGVGNLNRINRGEAISGNVTINIAPTVVIKAWDSEDIYRNRSEIKDITKAAVVEAIEKNQIIRNHIKRYCN